MLPIEQRFIHYNYSTRTQKAIYIVCHDTANTDKGSDALHNRDYFDGGNKKASADFFVDDHQIIQCVDYTKNYSWHCNDGHGMYGISNENSIGVEICINVDGDYNAAFNNGIELVAYLAKINGIDINHIVRHYDASRKICPGSMSGSNWELWYTFKSKVANISNQRNVIVPPVDTASTSTLISLGNKGSIVSDLQAKLSKLGYGLAIDGDFGPKTLAAVKDFQSKHNLAVDGIVGPKTLSALNDLASSHSSSSPMLIKQGNKGSTVSDLQTKLNKLGYSLVIDGDFGPKTLTAVRDFQSKHNLIVDGIVGPQTLTALTSLVS